MKYSGFFRCIGFLILFLTSQFVSGQSVMVEAVEGDGIYSILRKGRVAPNSASISEFRRLNKELIGENDRVYAGRSYMIPDIKSGDEMKTDTLALVPVKTLPDSILAKPMDSVEIEKVETAIVGAPISPVEDKNKKYLKIPLFGIEHEDVEVVSDQLKGTYYYLISGHGGPDPGAVGKIGKSIVSEDEYAYDVVLRLARRLLSHGATVYVIIRDNDDGIRADRILKLDRDEVTYPDKAIPRTQKARLKQRTVAVNDLYIKHKGNFQRLIITHVDSRSAGQNIDVFFYHDHSSKTGKAIALQLQKTFEEKYARFQPNRTYHGNVEARELYVLKNTYPPAVFIELGNIRNKADQKRFMIRENREALANWICSGLMEEYKNAKK
ncbi:MAG: N-acetylmuramoyl-L-alanine amidase [Cyclobacteriaceae bacterium]